MTRQGRGRGHEGFVAAGGAKQSHASAKHCAAASSARGSGHRGWQPVGASREDSAAVAMLG